MLLMLELVLSSQQNGKCDMRPCSNPSVCGVSQHRDGTECKATSRGASTPGQMNSASKLLNVQSAAKNPVQVGQKAETEKKPGFFKKMANKISESAERRKRKYNEIIQCQTRMNGGNPCICGVH